MSVTRGCGYWGGSHPHEDHPHPSGAITTAGLLITGPTPALAGDFHFRPVPIPAAESRLTELACVREFRGSYDLGEFIQGTLLIAELHVAGQPVKAFRLCRAKYDRAKQTRAGTLSFGWHRDARHLVR